jgi:hypothetical protein
MTMLMTALISQQMQPQKISCTECWGAEAVTELHGRKLCAGCAMELDPEGQSARAVLKLIRARGYGRMPGELTEF